MRKNVMAYINKLQGYRTAIKNLHWSANNMSEHKLVDDIDSSVSSIQDKVAEIAQGIYGQIAMNELKPKGYEITSTKKMLKDLLRDTQSFLKQMDKDELVGIRSEIETFVGEINQFIYLEQLCLKEDLRRRLNRRVDESKGKAIDNAMISQIVNETVRRMLKRII
jgi:hypothetical protein